MIVLRAIGAFFARIWRWIRETAWVQPLLIVGLIFGVMFSIKPIYNAIKEAQANSDSAETYYRQFQLSLSGEEESEASKLTYQIYQSMVDQENKIDSKYGLGNKFLLMFVAEECSECEYAKDGFEYFVDNFGFDSSSIYNPTVVNKDDKNPFNVVTIFIDEILDGDDEKDDTAFERYVERHIDFFASAGGQAQESPFVTISKGVESTVLDAIIEGDVANFYTPTIMLVDFSETCVDPTNGVIDIFVNLEESGSHSSSDANKADFLFDAWTSQGKFERK